MYRLIVLLVGLIAAVPAWAVCPTTPADCPSGTANNWTVANSLSVTGASTLSGGGTLSGTYAGNPIYSGTGIAASYTGPGAILLPVGTTGQQPDTGNAGEVRYNSTTGRYEFGVGGSWISHVRLSGDTMTGSLTLSAGTLAVAGTGTFATGSTVAGRISGGGAAATFTCTQASNCGATVSSVGSGNVLLQAPTPAASSGWLALNGTLSLKQATVITSGAGLGTGGLSPAAIWEDIAWSGTQDAGAAAPNFFRLKDAVVASVSPGFPMAVYDREYNAGADGSRIGVQIVDNKNVASLSGSNEFVELQVFGHYLAGEGGSAGNYKGSFWGENIDVSCQTGCDYIDRLKGTEWDIRSYTGTHLNAKIVTNVHWAQFDAVHGAVEDIGLAFDAATGIASGTGKGATLISIGKYNGDQPFDPSLTTTSAIMQVRPNISSNLTVPWQPYAAYGMDLSFMNFAQAAWWSSGFKIDGTGQVPIMGPGAISYSANTITIDAPNVVETSAVVAAGGATYQVGDEIKDTIGGLWSVATLTGNAVATVTLLKAGYATTCPVSPTATTGGGGNAGATLTITCSATTKGIKLAGASTALGFYGTTPIVKATPAGACAGNTGCQALRDALGNLGLINTGSITN